MTLRATTMLAALALVLGAGGPADAALIYNNGGPNQADGNEMEGWIQAEDFALAAAATITDVRFWAIESAGGYNGSITWTIYADGGTEPGAVLFRGNVAPARVATGITGLFGSYDEYQYDFSIGSVALAAGTYWLGLHNGTLAQDSPDFEFFWETTDPNGTLTGHEDFAPFDDGNWFDNSQQHAFALFGNAPAAVPEPASLALAGVAAVGLAARRVRRGRAA